MTDWAPPEEFDDYVIERPLGHGSMGRVYLAHDAVLARPVAVKFIAAVEPDAASRQRFLLEARATARLQHPNVVAIYRVGELDNKPYLVTEFVRGEALDKLAIPASPERVLDLGIDLSRGLAAAHRRGVIHGDIKPANAIIAEDGAAKLLDFGLATLADTAPAGGKPRAIAGTPDYMAPELWRGQPADRRSDVYALGAVLFHLLTGHPPFHDVAPRELARVVQERDAPTLAAGSGNARLVAVIDRCLARAPEQRFASGDELREALEQCRAHAAAPPLPGGNPYRGLRPFEADHRRLFFGRTAELGVVVDRLRAESFVLVAGESGSGKSSLCRAAVLPAVGDGALGSDRTWISVPLVPGRHPLRALATAIAGALEMGEDLLTTVLRGDGASVRAFFRDTLGTGRGLVVFCDQLEELTSIADPAEAAAADRALARLAAGLAGVRVLATARSDFLGRLAALPDLGETLTRALLFLRPLGPAEIREVIVGPAQATGVAFETEAMIDELVAATAGTDGGLPLLQFALAELWTARDTQANVITAAALASLGGVEGALARHADSVIAALTPAQRTAARRLLTQLVTNDGARTRRTEAELTAGDATARAALDALVRGRLLVAHEADDGSAYELSHEVLVRGWATLRGWLVEDADQRLLADRVHQAAGEWQRLHRGRDALWGTRQLGEAIRVREAELQPIDREFLTASRRKRMVRRWLIRGGIAAVPALVIATYFGVQLANQRALDRKVDRLRDEAVRELDGARRKARVTDDLRARAFALFDAPDVHADHPLAAGAEQWNAALSSRVVADGAYEHAARAFEVALSADPGRDDVRILLGKALLERAIRAELAHDGRLRDELVGRLSLYDPDGSVMAAWTAPARLELAVTPADAVVTIQRDGETERRPVEPGTLLAPGSYVIEATAAGHAALRHPIVARRATPTTLELHLVPAAAVPAGFVPIAAGEFEFGDSDDNALVSWTGTVPLHRRHSGPYLIGIHEVTFADWIEFLDALPPAEQRERTPRAGSAGGGTGPIKLSHAGGVWQLEIQPVTQLYTVRVGEPLRYQGRTRRDVQDWTRFPVTGVSATDAEAYAAWLDRTGRVPGARLCTEAEWERAARGADARLYPHGPALGPDDANIDVTYDQNAVAMGPDEVGSHPASRSPFGLDDMTGNAYEWTTSVLSQAYSLRGGSFYYNSGTGLVMNRQESTPEARTVMVGFRVCARWPGDLTPSDK